MGDVRVSVCRQNHFSLIEGERKPIVKSVMNTLYTLISSTKNILFRRQDLCVCVRGVCSQLVTNSKSLLDPKKPKKKKP